MCLVYEPAPEPQHIFCKLFVLNLRNHAKLLEAIVRFQDLEEVGYLCKVVVLKLTDREVADGFSFLECDPSKDQHHHHRAPLLNESQHDRESQLRRGPASG